MSSHASSSVKIPGQGHWRRPPWACPRCLGEISLDRQPRQGLESFGARCGSCGVALRFVRELVRPAQDGLEPIFIWVPVLLSDRRSRIAPRLLSEPNPIEWTGAGGGMGAVSGCLDPTSTLCDYPPPGCRIRIQRRWKLQLGNDPIVSVSAVHDELWAISAEGYVYVLRDTRASGGGFDPDLSGFDAPELQPVRGSPIRLGIRPIAPPAHHSSWWFVVGDGNDASFIQRSYIERDDASSWKVLRSVLDRSWSWVSDGWPLAIYGRPLPTFAAAAHDEHGLLHLLVFELSSDLSDRATQIAPKAYIPLPGAINEPVQVPLAAADERDTRECEREGQASLLGALLWTDDQGAVWCIQTQLVEPTSWQSVLLADPSGLVELDPQVAAAAHRTIPPLPPVPRAADELARPHGPAGPRQERSVAGKPGLPPVPSLLASSSTPRPGAGLAGSPPPLPSLGDSADGPLRPLPNSGGGHLPPLHRAALPPLPAPGAPLTLRPRAAPAIPAARVSEPRLSPDFRDRLCVTIAPFASPGRSTVLPGIRLWSVVRPRDGGRVQVRHIALRGGNRGSGSRSWSSVESGACFDAVSRDPHGAALWTSMQPIFITPGTSDPGRNAAHVAVPLVFATESAASAFLPSNLLAPLNVPRPSVDDMPMACAPIVTPYGVVAIYRRRVEVWSHETDGSAFVDTYPSAAGHISQNEDRENHEVVVLSSASVPVSPALVANTLWVPSETGALYCFSLVPDRD